MKNSQGISVSITPFTGSGFVLDWVQIKERLGGELANGEASFLYPNREESVDNIFNINTAIIQLTDEKAGGFCFDIPISITDRTFEQAQFRIAFVCVADPKFFSTRISGYYTDICEALTTLYPGNTDGIRVTSDQNNALELFQNCETSFNFINRIFNSYKKDIVFGFMFDGLLIKDLIGISSTGRDENKIENLPSIVGGGTKYQTNVNPYQLSYSRKQNYDIINPWTDSNNSLQTTYEDNLPKNVISVLGSEYYICRSGYENLLKNHLQNRTRFVTGFNGGYTITGTIMPNNYRLGDIIMYMRADESQVMSPSPSYTRCLVYSNEVFWSANECKVVGPYGFKFEWTTELRLIEKGPWSILSEKEQEENNNPTSF